VGESKRAHVLICVDADVGYVCCKAADNVVFPGHLHKSAMMHFSHSGRRATQV
jgi:hypothetical protein